MRRITLPLVAVALMGAAPLKPTGWVNDYANIIPDDREAVLEQKLDQFEHQTTVEIAVVTTPSLEGEDIETWTTRLFRQWGVGKAENNNGLMVVVAPAEHKYRIEVGYGLEPFVTDADASQLGRDTLPDAFRQSDYAGGLDRLTDGIIQEIGRLSPAERAQYIVAKNNEAVRQAKRAAERRVMFWERAGNFLAGILSLGGSIFVILFLRKKWKRWQARRRIRKALRVRLVALNDFYRKKGVASVLHMSRSLSAVPKWMQGDVLHHRAELELAIHQLHELIDVACKAKDRSEEDLELKAAQIVRAEEMQAKYEEHEQALGDIPSRVQAVREEAADKVLQVSEKVTSLKYFAESLQSKGISLSGVYESTLAEDIDTKLRTLKALLANRTEGQGDESEQIIGLVETLQALVTEKGDALTLVSSRRTVIESLHDDLKERIGICSRRQSAIESQATELCAALPEERVHEVQRCWQKVARATELQGTLQALPMDTKSQARKQVALERRLRSLKTSVEQMEEATSRLQTLTDQYQHAKSGGYEEALGQAGAAIRSAMDVLEHQDVGRASQNTITRANAVKTEAVRLAHAPKPDWIGAVAALGTAIDLAGQAKCDAERDIESAKQARARAAQRRQDDERRRRRQRDDDSGGFSGGGFSSSSSSSNDSFGGFGGGSSGGGGASGSW